MHNPKKQKIKNTEQNHSSSLSSVLLLTFNVGGCSVGDVAVHEIGRGDRANVARERRQVRVAGVREDVVLRGNDRKGRKRHVHLHTCVGRFGVAVEAAYSPCGGGARQSCSPRV